jgi:hypothetical protein
VSLSQGHPAGPTLTPDQQSELIQGVKNSLRSIEIELDRHDMLNAAYSSFEDNELRMIKELLERRDTVQKQIDKAAAAGNFTELVSQLTVALGFNCDVMEVLAHKFVQLVEEDHQQVRKTLARSAPAQSG